MNAYLSVELPTEYQDLVSESAFENYIFGNVNQDAQARLSEIRASDLFPNGILDSQMADCCVSGLWLLHNFLDKSHDICQDIPSREGSFWHAIMHRLEGDYWNSKYWYRKVGNHAAFGRIEPNWNPENFVDDCEASQGSQDERIKRLAIQEWSALFEYCFENAG